MKIDIGNVVKVAEKAAYLGAKIIRSEWQKSSSFKTKSNPNDLKTRTDDASERAIISYLTKEFPGYAIYAEESRKHGQKVDPEVPTWVVDPLDATTNFSLGIMIVAVAIALMYRGKVVVGVVADVFQNEHLAYVAFGKKAFCRRRNYHFKPLAVCGNDGHHSRMIAYETPSAKDRMPLIHVFMGKANEIMHPPRIFGCAALSLCFLAQGKIGGYVNAQLDDWDVAAGLRIVERAGGMLTDWHGREWHPHGGHHGIIAAATPEIHARLMIFARQAMEVTRFDPNKMK